MRRGQADNQKFFGGWTGLIKESIQKLVAGANLSYEESLRSMNEIMAGAATNAQIAAFLTALRMKGETVDEIVAFASVMRENCSRIRPNIHGRLVDTCGTGGDKLKTFNISTTAAFVVAGAGVPIAKHGNRSVTSRSGSADVLEYLGVNLIIQPEEVGRIIEQVGIGFMFAPCFHPAMRHALAPRKEIGIRTVFNMLGPLTNPASANAQLLGVYEPKLTEQLAYVLKGLDCEEAMVVHGTDGLDEVSTLGKTIISHLKEGEVVTKEISPINLGMKQAIIEDIRGTSPQENAEILFKIINEVSEKNDPKTDIVLANAAAALIVGGKAQDFKEGIALARESVRSGAASKKLCKLVQATHGDISQLERLEQRYA